MNEPASTLSPKTAPMAIGLRQPVALRGLLPYPERKPRDEVGRSRTFSPQAGEHLGLQCSPDNLIHVLMRHATDARISRHSFMCWADRPTTWC